MKNQRVKKKDVMNQDGGFKRLCTLIHDKHLTQMVALIEKRPGVTKKSVLYSALEHFFDPLPDTDLVEQLSRDIKYIKQDVRKLLTTQQVFIDAFSVFIKVWLCHTRDVPEDERDVALASMNRRFEQYKELVVNEINGGGELIKLLEGMMQEEGDGGLG